MTESVKNDSNNFVNAEPLIPAASVPAPSLPAASSVLERVRAKMPQSPFLRLIIYLLLLFLLILIWQIIDSFPFGGVTISPQTTVLVTPRTTNGRQIDYLRVFKDDSPKIQSEENGFRIIVEEIGPHFFFSQASYSSDQQESQIKKFCEELGIDPKISAKNPLQECFNAINDDVHEIFPIAGQAEERRMMMEEFDAFGQEFGFLNPSSDLERMMKKWVEKNSPALDSIAKALEKPIFSVPLLTDSTIPLVKSLDHHPISALRIIVRSFRYRALCRVLQHDIDGAIADINAIHRLSRHLINQPHLFARDASLAIALERYTAVVPLGIDLKASPSSTQWVTLIKNLATTGVSGSSEGTSPAFYLEAEKILEAERLLMLDYLQGIACGTWPSSAIDHKDSDGEIKVQQPSLLQKTFDFVSRASLDWNTVMAEANALYLNNWDELGDLLPQYEKLHYFLTEKGRSKLMAYQVAYLHLHGRESLAAGIKSGQCAFNMTRIVYAMRRYQEDKGTLPPTFTLDTQGKPLHSWRVLLLPYLESSEAASLYANIRLDEPWDSEFNQQFHRISVPYYQCPACITRVNNIFTPEDTQGAYTREERKGQTSYSVIVGDTLLFDASGKGKNILEMQEKNPEQAVNQMIVLVERADPICWMNPDSEIPEKQGLYTINIRKYMFDDNGDFIRNRLVPNLTREGIKRIPVTIGSFHAGGANIGFLAGCTFFIREKIDENLFAQYLTGVRPQEINESSQTEQ